MINDIRKALLHIKKWQVQNDEMDSKTNFIYDCGNYIEVIMLADHYWVSYEYALCRWYNFATSKQCEEIFCKYGAVPEENEKNHDIDFYINDVPFDLKLTVLSSKYPWPKPIGRLDKNRYIQWLRENASKESRSWNNNRLYVVVNSREEKSDFFRIDTAIHRYMNYTNERWFNELWGIKSDVIYLSH